MSAPPRVSIITPFLNQEKFLSEAIASVYQQSFRNWDLWLIDDGSSDHSSDIARQAASGSSGRVHYVDHPGHENRGAPASRNLGISRSNGEYLAFLDSDDVWRPEKLAQQVGALDEHPPAGMACEPSENWYSWSGENAAQPDSVVPMLAELGLEQSGILEHPLMLLRAYPLGTAAAPCPSSLLVRRRFVDRFGAFDESFRGCLGLYEDQTLLAKIYLHTSVFVGARPNHRYRYHNESLEATVTSDGHYWSVRRYFLNWLTAYYHSQGVTNPVIWKAVRDATTALPSTP